MDTSKSISIVGCGFSGIAMGVKLLQAGVLNFTIYEKSMSYGGTWYDNTYPDCGCDVPSVLYSYSFELYPNWDRFWAKQHQILGYLGHVVEKYGLQKHIQLNTKVQGAQWNNDTATWRVELHGPLGVTEVKTDFIVMANGSLHVPQYPTLKGLSNIDGSTVFQGDSFHAAKWDHRVSLANKRVGIVGSGASAIQIVPEIAKIVKELYVFQRTAPWIFYKTDFCFPNVVKEVFRLFPFTMRLLRYIVYIATEIRFGGLYVGSFFNWWMQVDSIRYLKSVIKDKDLQRKVTPTLVCGCKRMLFSSFWYPALCRSNVHVVTDRITGVCERGISIRSTPENLESIHSDSAISSVECDKSSDRIIDLDAIIYATGFQVTRANAPPKYAFDVVGINGYTLSAWMKDGPCTLLGITAPQFPNLFFLYGPNSNLGHNSIIFMIECQVNYILKLMRLQNKHNFRYLQVKDDVVKEYHSNVIERGLVGKVWDGCSSWYRWPVKQPDGSVTNSGFVYSLWPHSTVWYYWKTLWPRVQDYRVTT